jgi:hypothetical protein
VAIRSGKPGESRAPKIADIEAKQLALLGETYHWITLLLSRNVRQGQGKMTHDTAGIVPHGLQFCASFGGILPNLKRHCGALMVR